MAKMSRKEDCTQTSIRRTRHFFEAIETVDQRHGTSFFDLDVEGKKRFLEEHYREIVNTCIAKFGSGYQNLWNFNAFIVENEGNAVIYFERRPERKSS